MAFLCSCRVHYSVWKEVCPRCGLDRPEASKPIRMHQGVPIKLAKQTQLEIAGRASWKMLHEYVFTSPAEYKCWLLKYWRRTVPDSDCGCGTKADSLIAKLDSEELHRVVDAESCFAFGVWMHNEVNKSLSKKLVTLAAAKELWNNS